MIRQEAKKNRRRDDENNLLVAVEVGKVEGVVDEKTWVEDDGKKMIEADLGESQLSHL